MELLEAESNRVKRGQPGNLDAQDYAVRGNAVLYNKAQSAETNEEALKWLQQAIALDENNADAWTGLAYAYTRAGVYGWSAEPRERLAQRALDAHYQLTLAFRHVGEMEKSNAAADKCMELNRNNALCYFGRGVNAIYSGQPEQAFPLMNKVIALSPREQIVALVHFWLGYAAFLLGRDADAIDESQRCLALNDKYPDAYFLLAAAHAQRGELDAARTALSGYLKLSGGYDTIARLRARRVISRNPTYLSQIERLYAGLRKAGLPEE
jgi:tetratricopeptide (TPR) repeat protein